MITGAIIFFVGALVGWLAKPVPKGHTKNRILEAFKNQHAKILDMDEREALDLL